MNKFAFRSQQEKKTILALLNQAPLVLKPTFISIAQNLANMPIEQQQPPALKDDAVEESLNGLREILNNYLEETHLDQNPSAVAFVDQVIEKMRPAVTQSIGGSEDLWSRLQSTPWQKKTPSEEAGEDLRSQLGIPSDEMDSGSNPMTNMLDMMEPAPGTTAELPPKPEVLTQNEKLSPKKPAPLWRKKPPMSTGAGLKEKTMQKDETFDAIVASMLDLADMADEAGLLEASDKLAAVLPAMRSVKVAQYEGFQNYWIANGRAFEMAYKQKRSKGKTDPKDFRSPHEVWFEILEEYQKSLLTNQADFISKYANKNFEQTDKASSAILMSRISSRMQAGASPGVALYESIDELAGGQHFRLVGANVFGALEKIEKDAVEAGHVAIADKAGTVKKTAANWFGKLLRYLGFNYGNPTTSIPKVLTDGVKRKLVNDLGSLYYRSQSTPTPVSELYRTIGQYYDLITEFSDRARYVKRKGIPTLQEPESVAGPDGNIDPNKMAGFVNNIQSALAYIHPDVAERIDKDIYANSEGLEGSAANYLPPGDAESAAPMTPAGTPGSPDPLDSTTPTGPEAPQTPPTAPAVNIGETFTKQFAGMPIEEQFALLEKVMPLIQKWYKLPAAEDFMGKKGVTPTGSPYKAKAPAPAAPPMSTGAPVQPPVPTT